ETGNDSPGVLQSLLQCRHYLCSFEVECIRPHRNLKRRMVHENRDRLGSLALDQIDQMADPLRAKVTLLLPELKVSNAISLTGYSSTAYSIKSESGARYPCGAKASRRFVLLSLLPAKTYTGARAVAIIATACAYSSCCPL